MTTNWSSEDVVCELRDVKATAAAIDYSGRFLLLSGRLATPIVDLNNPQIVLKKILRKSRWEVGVAAWNYHHDYKHLIAVGSNQRVDILNFEYGSADLVDNGHSIKGLTRTVLDLDWNNTDPGLIVTCSVDNYVNIWDYKDLRKPVASLPSVCGASQAKWSKTGKNFLATAHEADCKIWDFRKASTPVEYISAHSSKVNGIDWNPNNANQLVTCAQDHYIKVWDITALKKPEIVIQVSAPVWRARFAPFGEALVTTGIPQLHRGDTKLSVWALNDVIAPIHQFSGHTEGVYDFFWRPLRYNEYQLVSWSKDQTLRLWKTDSSIQKQCGAAYLNHTIVLDYHHHDFSENVSSRGKENYPSSMASSMFSADGISPPSSAVSPLDKELRSIDIANVTVEEVDLKLRVCSINVNAGQHLVKLHLSFPLGYPEISIPSFQISAETTLNANAVKQVTHSVKATFERCLKNQAVSVVAGIRTIVQFLSGLSADTSPSPRLETHPAFISPPTPSPKPAVSPWVNPPPSASRYSSQRTQESPLISAATAKLFGKPGVTTSFQSDTVIPFPRICGACFAGDKLVMWSDAWKLGMSSGGTRVMLDRGMSGIFPSELSIRQRQVRRQLKKKGKAEKSSIVVYKVDGLLSVHPLLAAGYSSDCLNPTRSFLFNADLAEKHDRRDLAHVWRLLAVTLSTASYPGYSLPSSDTDDAPWSLHPFGRRLVDNVINYYRENYDSSFLAVLLCILCRSGPQDPPSPSISSISPDKPLPSLLSRGGKSASVLGLSPKMSSSRGDETLDMWLQTRTPSHLRSNSWSFTSEDRSSPFKRISEEYIQECPERYLLDPERKQEFDLYKKEYCDLLYSFQLLNKRAEIAKCLGSPPEPHKGVELLSVCHNCSCDNRGSRCFRCNVIVVSCSICRFPVRGLSTFCFACGHGGHLNHMQTWFETRTLCPTGCGCSCLEALKLS